MKPDKNKREDIERKGVKMKEVFNSDEIYQVLLAKYQSEQLNQEIGIHSEWYEFLLTGNYEEKLDLNGLMNEFTEALNQAFYAMKDKLNQLDHYNRGSLATKEFLAPEIPTLQTSILKTALEFLNPYLIK